MTDKYLVIFTDKETGKYDHYDLYSKEIATEEELLQRIELWNKEEKNKLKATYHNNDVFADFVEDVSSTRGKRIIECLESIVSSIHTNICELDSWADDIQELLEEYNNDR